MVLIVESRNDAEANIAVAGTGARAGAGAQQRVVPKRSLEYMIKFAYVFHQLEKRLAPCVTVQSILELAAHLSTHMQLVMPRQQFIEPSSKNQLIEPPPAQMLRFTKEIPAAIFTNDTIDLQIELVNIKSGLICSTGEPSSSSQVEIFVTRGDFPSNDKKLRKCKPLRQRERAHKLPLLVPATCTQTARRRGLSFKNTVVAKMNNGRAVAKVKITDNSSWVNCKMFKLVARVKGRRIKEALSEAFAVKESKLKGKKADVPSPTDPTSKLNYVGNKSNKILQAMGINTVQDLLNKLESDPEGLKATVGMQNTKWESTIHHARQCRVSPEQEPSMTETNEETLLNVSVPISGVTTITDHLLNVSVPNAGWLHTPEIQAQYMEPSMTETNEETLLNVSVPISGVTTITDHLLNVLVPNAGWPHTPEIQAQYMEPSMTETNEETLLNVSVPISGVTTITDHLLNVSVPNAGWPHTPEIQAQYMVMGQQRDPATSFGSEYSNSISSLNGNNGSFVFCSSPSIVSMPSLPISCSTASYGPHPVFCSFPSTVPMSPLLISHSTASYGPHSGEVFGEMSGQPEMPEQASTGQGMTMVNGSNYTTIISDLARLESNRWKHDYGFYA